MRTLPQGALDALADQHTGDPWVWLYHIVADFAEAATTVFQFAAIDQQIHFDEKTYYPYPVKKSVIEESSEGSLPLLQISFSNITLM